MNKGFIGVGSNGRVRAPRALDSNSVVDTSGTVDFRSTKVVFTGWWWRRGGTSVQFGSTTLSDRSTASFNEGSVWWLDSDVLWAPSALDT